MDKRYIAIIFLVFATFNVTSGLEIYHNWILTQLVKLLICFVVFLIFSMVLNMFSKKKVKN